MKTTRSSFKSFKAKALENPEVKAEYNSLKPIFELKQLGKSCKKDTEKKISISKF